MEKQRIRFVDSLNNTLFYINDGEDIEIETKNGWVQFTCHYVDDYHFKLNNCLYHLIAFAEIRERFVQRYRPAKKETKLDDEPKKKIRFVKKSYETLFSIYDGEEIEAKVDGVWKRYACKYLDECHVEIIGICFHINDFADRMEKANQSYRPVNSESHNDNSN